MIIIIARLHKKIFFHEFTYIAQYYVAETVTKSNDLRQKLSSTATIFHTCLPSFPS